ncbi:MAG: FAD:protein FMN transferase [Cephaloticoccus sp.]|nr:FAD:protein FMN transferase [Cephaloticoccus sp.]MCF7759912.1 FAD:protein FMN transferase [Cephaloticoccus sp.]
MTTCSSTTDLRRARPLLGTLVEITLPASPHARTAMEHAFGVIARVQTLMSAHDQASDLGRISAARVGIGVSLDRWTWRVLAAAQHFAAISDGAFDAVATASQGNANWRDLELLPDRRTVRCRRGLRLDLGGIAKGFAVDQAVRVLRRAGLTWGLVNAGGDLRAFGRRSWPISVRHPVQPGALLPFGQIQNAACATSAPYFSRQTLENHVISDLRNPLQGGFITATISVTVSAPTTIVADALTKIMLIAPTNHEILLKSHRAHAWFHQPNQEFRHAS